MNSWCNECGILVEPDHTCPPEGEHSEDGKWRVVVHTPDGIQHRSGASRAFARDLIRRMPAPKLIYTRGPHGWFAMAVTIAGLWQLLLWSLEILRWAVAP